MAAGQCKTDPVSGVAGTIYNAWTADADAGLAPAALVSGSTVRKLLGAQVGAVASAIDAIAGDHNLGTSVAWSAGTGAGQYSFGAAAPNAVLVSIAGCDEGGIISFTTGANTASGTLFEIYFASAFPHPPAGVIFAADDNASDAMFNYKWKVTSTTAKLTVTVRSPLPNATFTWQWIAKGRT